MKNTSHVKRDQQRLKKWFIFLLIYWNSHLYFYFLYDIKEQERLIYLHCRLTSVHNKIMTIFDEYNTSWQWTNEQNEYKSNVIIIVTGTA